jgi:sensor histidine kinase YesM
VENSIQHGLEPQVQGGSITVRASAASGVLTLEVADTGKGLDPSANPADGKGFGLRQVRERLATLYGTTAAIEFVADRAGGTRASITFPLNS